MTIDITAPAEHSDADGPPPPVIASTRIGNALAAGAGGAVVALAGALSSGVFPFGYLSHGHGDIGVWAMVGLALRLAAAAFIGICAALTAPDRGLRQSFLIGLGAPAALAALIGLSEMKPADNTPAIDRCASESQVIFSALHYGVWSLPLVVADAPCFEAAATRPAAEPSRPSAQPQPGAPDPGSTSFDLEGAIGGDIPSVFQSAARKIASNAIVDFYQSGSANERQAIVAKLFDAIQADGYYRYRINLYILRTLALLGDWSPTAEQTARLEELSRTSDARDPTFNDWLLRVTESDGPA